MWSTKTSFAKLSNARTACIDEEVRKISSVAWKKCIEHVIRNDDGTGFNYQ